MTGIIVAFSRQEDAISIKNILVRNGYDVTAVCTGAANVLAATDGLHEGIVVCGYRIKDMPYEELRENLPQEFEMLVLATPAKAEGSSRDGVIHVAVPLKVYDLITTLKMIEETIIRKKRKRRSMPRQRTPEEQRILNDAKRVLMDRNHMSEEEAHRYIQKLSMDSGRNMSETAEMILDLF